MLIGVPIFALIYGYLDNVIKISLTEKELPINVNEYYNLERINTKTKKKKDK